MTDCGTSTSSLSHGPIPIVYCDHICQLSRYLLLTSRLSFPSHLIYTHKIFKLRLCPGFASRLCFHVTRGLSNTCISQHLKSTCLKSSSSLTASYSKKVATWCGCKHLSWQKRTVPANTRARQAPSCGSKFCSLTQPTAGNSIHCVLTGWGWPSTLTLPVPVFTPHSGPPITKIYQFFFSV